MEEIPKDLYFACFLKKKNKGGVLSAMLYVCMSLFLESLILLLFLFYASSPSVFGFVV